MTKKTLSNIIFYGGLLALVAGFFIYSAFIKNRNYVIETNDTFLLENVFDVKSMTVIAEQALVIEFYSPSCPACKLIDPFFKGLSKDFKDEVKFYKVDTTKFSRAAMLFPIRGVPSVVFVKPGESLENLTITTGFRPKTLLKGHVEKLLE